MYSSISSKYIFPLLIGCVVMSAKVSAAVCYSLSSAGNTMTISVLPNTNYTTAPTNRWVTGNVTLSWPATLGSTVIASYNAQNGFTFAPDGLPALNGGVYYQKFGFTFGTPYLFSMTNGVSVPVLQVVVSHPSIPTGSFSIVPVPPNPPANGNASFNNVLGEEYAPGSCNLSLPNVPLPLDLLSFTASYKQKVVVLDWETSREDNLSFYELQRSESSQRFVPIGEVQALNSTTAHYQWTDEKLPEVNRLFYRLKVVENDGSATFSPVRVVEIPHAPFQLTVAPVPTADQVTLLIQTDRDERALVEITDEAGRMVYSRRHELNEGGNRIQLSALSWPSGAYVVSVRSDRHRAEQRLIVQR